MLVETDRSKSVQNKGYLSSALVQAAPISTRTHAGALHRTAKPARMSVGGVTSDAYKASLLSSRGASGLRLNNDATLTGCHFKVQRKAKPQSHS